MNNFLLLCEPGIVKDKQMYDKIIYISNNDTKINLAVYNCPFLTCCSVFTDENYKVGPILFYYLFVYNCNDLFLDLKDGCTNFPVDLNYQKRINIPLCCL